MKTIVLFFTTICTIIPEFFANAVANRKNAVRLRVLTRPLSVSRIVIPDAPVTRSRMRSAFAPMAAFTASVTISYNAAALSRVNRAVAA
jgi:hypothetical protein